MATFLSARHHVLSAAALLWVCVLPGWLSVALSMFWQWCQYGCLIPNCWYFSDITHNFLYSVVITQNGVQKSDVTSPTKDLMNRDKSVSGDEDQAEGQNVTNAETGIVSVLDYLFSYLPVVNS